MKQFILKLGHTQYEATQDTSYAITQEIITALYVRKSWSFPRLVVLYKDPRACISDAGTHWQDVCDRIRVAEQKYKISQMEKEK